MSYIERAKQNKIDREELAAYRAEKSQRELMEAADAARLEGSDDAYADVMQQLDRAAADQSSGIIAGSLVDVQMQRNMDAGYNYSPPSNEGLLDAINSQLSVASDKVSDWFSGALQREEPVDPYSARSAQAEEDLRQSAYGSAFNAAELSGGRSEENMNKLVTQELLKRGL